MKVDVELFLKIFCDGLQEETKIQILNELGYQCELLALVGYSLRRIEYNESKNIFFNRRKLDFFKNQDSDKRKAWLPLASQDIECQNCKKFVPFEKADDLKKHENECWNK